MNTTNEPRTKSARKDIRIGTHSGTFHCDEVLACFMLKILPEYEDATIVRTRTSDKLDECDIVVDVGGEYNPSKHRYDHHQRTFNESMHSLKADYPWVTKLSSAGLIYFHFGERIISHILGTELNGEETKVIYKKVYENFMEEIDAIDNGISTHDEPPRYHISTNLSSRVKHLNPPWNQPSVSTEEGFYKAFTLVGKEFKDKVSFYKDVWWPARKLIENALEDRFQVDKSGEIVELKQGGCPWRDHLLTLEEDLKIEPIIKYVIYTDENGNWRIQCVPVRQESFENRLSLKEEWRGLRDEELSKKSGIPGCVFVHSSGFIGGNKTREGVLEMARATLESRS